MGLAGVAIEPRRQAPPHIKVDRLRNVTQQVPVRNHILQAHLIEQLAGLRLPPHHPATHLDQTASPRHTALTGSSGSTP